jgi:hypothetical protein
MEGKVKKYSKRYGWYVNNNNFYIFINIFNNLNKT